MVDEAALEGAVQDFVLMVNEGLHTFVLQFADDAGTHIHNLFVGVAQLLVLDALEDALTVLLVKEAQHQLRGLGKAHNLQLVSIFQVHNLIADVIGSLYQEHQWMTGVAQRFAVFRQSLDSHFLGQPLIGLLLALEETELPLLACCRRGVGIFHDTCRGGVGHHKTARASALKLVRQQSEGVGITLEVGDVVPERR